jgi:16S rRNA (guanine966-N2)-methyltransferase
MPSPRGFTARPTTDFAKEGLFNILFNYFNFEEKDVLDLFSGSGGISYEFASRGCANVTAIEKYFKHWNYMRIVIEKFNIQEITPLKLDAFKYLEECRAQYNIIFADPPYDLEGVERIPELVFEKNLLKHQGMLVVEHSKATDFSHHKHFILHKSYGSVNFSFFE